MDPIVVTIERVKVLGPNVYAVVFVEGKRYRVRPKSVGTRFEVGEKIALTTLDRAFIRGREWEWVDPKRKEQQKREEDAAADERRLLALAERAAASQVATAEDHAGFQTWLHQAIDDLEPMAAQADGGKERFISLAHLCRLLMQRQREVRGQGSPSSKAASFMEVLGRPMPSHWGEESVDEALRRSYAHICPWLASRTYAESWSLAERLRAESADLEEEMEGWFGLPDLDRGRALCVVVCRAPIAPIAYRRSPEGPDEEVEITAAEDLRALHGLRPDSGEEYIVEIACFSDLDWLCMAEFKLLFLEESSSLCTELRLWSTVTLTGEPSGLREALDEFDDCSFRNNLEWDDPSPKPPSYPAPEWSLRLFPESFADATIETVEMDG